jgi:elongation factor Ts
MQISAQQVAQLREMTGAGMMDCKKALVENSGDLSLAAEYLRKKGIASAAKKAGRTAKEGTVFSLVDSDSKAAVLVEVNCETDFVAKTENFTKFVTAIAKHIAVANPATPEALLTQKMTGDASKTVEDTVKEAISILGENIMVRRFVRYPLAGGKEVKSYIHAGGKVGVLIEVSLTKAEAATLEPFQGMLRDLTMHVAAAGPQYLDAAAVPADIVAKEKEIALAQLAGQNKPADVLEKIATGKINKYYEETCLVNQKFVKDDKMTIATLLTQTGKATGDTHAILRYARFVLGEGVEVTAEETH